MYTASIEDPADRGNQSSAYQIIISGADITVGGEVIAAGGSPLPGVLTTLAIAGIVRAYSKRKKANTTK